MKIIGIAILLAFYAVYLGKMALQRRQGIQTDQIARNKARGKLFYIELTMKIATYAVVLVEVVSIFVAGDSLPMAARIPGAMLAIAGVVVFALAVVTMRDSWRAGISINDQTELVTTGIYRYSRNPAFLGFDLVYAGLLLMFFNWPLLAFTAFATLMLHLQILQEEAWLPTAFGDEYLQYKAQVRRYLGRY